METWPVLFMYPAPAGSPGDLWRQAGNRRLPGPFLALAKNARPVVSPVFELYRRWPAYILLQEVERATVAKPAATSLFGNTMTALLVIRSDALLPARIAGCPEDDGLCSDRCATPERSDNRLFSHEAEPSGRLDTMAAAALPARVRDRQRPQPTVLSFEQQLAWMTC